MGKCTTQTTLCSVTKDEKKPRISVLIIRIGEILVVLGKIGLPETEVVQQCLPKKILFPEKNKVEKLKMIEITNNGCQKI